jgi:predicted nucleotidyltransferase
MYPIFVTIVGSKLYNTATETSDTDFKGICFPEIDEIIGLNHFEQQELKNGISDGPDKSEGVIYSTSRYLNLCLKGNPTVIEIAFANEKFWLHTTDIGKEICQVVRNNFLTKHLFKPYSAYHTAQIRKLQTQNPIGKRAKIVEEFGYDVKFAMHSFRLAKQCIQIMKTGWLNPSLDGDEKELAIQIRKGKFSKEEVLKILNDLDKEMYDSYKNSNLKQEPNFKSVNEFVKRLNLNYLNGVYSNQFKEFVPFKNSIDTQKTTL